MDNQFASKVQANLKEALAENDDAVAAQYIAIAQVNATMHLAECVKNVGEQVANTLKGLAQQAAEEPAVV